MSDEKADLILKELRELRAIVAPAGHGSEGARPSSPAGALLTKKQVAARIGGKCSERKVERLVAAGKLKKVPNLGRRTVRFRPVDVERFLQDKDDRPGRRQL